MKIISRFVNYFSGIPFFVHGVSTTSALGLVLWIFGYMIDFNSGNMVKQKKEESLGKNQF